MSERVGHTCPLTDKAIMMAKTERTCRICKQTYTGRYCKNRRCEKNIQARARNRSAARRRRHGGVRASASTILSRASWLNGDTTIGPIIPSAAACAQPEERQELAEHQWIGDHPDACEPSPHDDAIEVLEWLRDELQGDAA